MHTYLEEGSSDLRARACKVAAADVAGVAAAEVAVAAVVTVVAAIAVAGALDVAGAVVGAVSRSGVAFSANSHKSAL